MGDVHRVYIKAITKVGGYSAAVDVIAWDEIEAQDLVLDYWPLIGLPEHEYMEVEATRDTWWVKVWLKRATDPSWRFELRDLKEW